MSGAKCVAINNKSDAPRAVFTHCYGYCIHLAASDIMKTSRIMKDVLATTHEITRLVKYSPETRRKVGAN